MEDQTENPFFPECLVRCTMYQLTSCEPRFVGHIDEGNVAFYGLILQSRYDRTMQQYLLLSARDNLWEYQHGFGVTAADSALVIEGLLETGVKAGYLRESIGKLFELFYEEGEGAFNTVTGGRAEYWRGVSVETTAHAAYLAYRIVPDEFSSEIMRCARYVAGAQNANGSWNGEWFPSVMIPTYYATRFLHQVNAGHGETISLAENYIIGSQNENGSWFDSVIDTSAAVLTLKLLGSSEPARQKAKDWLVSEKCADGWRGEPVLYYWFENENGRLFHSCHDRGKITTAWATLALR